MKAALFAATLALAGTLAAAQETYSTWTHHRDVFLNTTNTTGGANVTADVIGFPVLVRLDGRDSAVFTAAKAGGADLRFTKEGDVVRLKHQVDTWDAAGRMASVWVLVDTVKGNNKTQKIRMHWGKADAADSSSGSAVFTTANGFFNVWHLGDATGISPRPSAVTGGDPAVPENFPAGYAPVDGLIGKAESLRGGIPPDVSDRFTLGSGTGYSSWESGFTFSVWAKPLDVQNHSPFFSSSNGYAVGASDVIIIGRQESTDLIKFRVRTGSGSYSGPNTAGDILLDQWQHFAFTRGGNTGTARIYRNGVEVIANETMAAFAVTARPNNYLGGSFSPNDNNYSGLLDEARLSKVARSANWLKLEYENQKPGGGLAFFDSASPRPPLRPMLAYAPDSLKLTPNVPMIAVTPTLSGGAADSITVQPPLPAGLTLNKTTGMISGTPATAAANTSAVHVFTAVNAGGSTTDSLVIAVGASAGVIGGMGGPTAFSISPWASGIAFRMPHGSGRASLTLLDVWGRTIWEGAFVDGALTWDGRTASGAEAGSGLYLARVTVRDAQGKLLQVLDRRVPFTR